MPQRPDSVEKKPKNYSWSKDLSGIKNLPTENFDELRRYKGHKDAIHLIRLIRKDHVAPGEYGYVQVYLGRILDNTFIPEEEYRRLYKRNGTLRVLPGKKSDSSSPAQSESSAKEDGRAEPLSSSSDRKDDGLKFEEKLVGLDPVLWELAEVMGIQKDLEDAFGKPLMLWIMTAAFYQIQNEGFEGCRLTPWCEERFCPIEWTGNDSEVSGVLHAIGKNTDGMHRYFKARKLRAPRQEKVLFDSTNMPCESNNIELVKPGKGKPGTVRNQISLSILYTPKNLGVLDLCLYEGDVSDQKNFKEMFRRLVTDTMGSDHNFAAIVDRGYFSKEILDMVSNSEHRILAAAKKNPNWIAERIESNSKELDRIENSIPGRGELTGITIAVEPDGSTSSVPASKVWLHIYKDHQEHARLKTSFLNDLHAYIECKRNGLPTKRENDDKIYSEFVFGLKNRRTDIREKWPEIKEHVKDMGVFVNVTSWECTAAEALELYQDRDSIEKCFQVAKSNLDGEAVRVHSCASLWGRGLIAAVAMTLCGQIRYRLSKKSAEGKLPRGARRKRLSEEEKGVTLNDVIMGFESLRVIRDDAGDVRYAPMTKRMEDYAKALDVSLDQVPVYCNRDFKHEVARAQINLKVKEVEEAEVAEEATAEAGGS